MSSPVSLSFELICLLNWLVRREKALLNTLVKRAVENGFVGELEIGSEVDSMESPEQLYTAVLDFLEFLEQALIRNLETIQVDGNTKDRILPALQKIEPGNLDLRTVWLSMQQTKTRLKKELKMPTQTSQRISEDEKIVIQGPEKILFEQLLKNWKPTNKETLN